MVTWLTWDLETGINLTVMCVSCCGFLYKVLFVVFSLSRCEVFLLCLVNSRHIQLITYLLSATCCCFRPKSSWSSNQWSVSVVFYSNCVSAEASLWYAQNDSVSRTVIEDKITGDWEVVLIGLYWGHVNDACEREPERSKELDVDSHKDIDVGIQLPSPASAVYVWCETETKTARLDFPMQLLYNRHCGCTVISCLSCYMITRSFV